MHKLMHTLHTRTHTHTNKLATVLHMIVDLKISLKVFWRYCLFLPIVMWVGGGGGGGTKGQILLHVLELLANELALQLHRKKKNLHHE